MQSIEITKHNTLCCNAPVHIKHIRLPNYASQEPYCSKCGKFPEAPLSALKAALKELNKLNISTKKNMYKFIIDPEKWVNVGELELEQNKPYWFKKANGQIVMGTPYTNGHSSGIADVYAEDGCLRIKGNTFHIVKGGQVQEVLN